MKKKKSADAGFFLSLESLMSLSSLVAFSS
jgi:hypothetical protein